MKDVLIVGQGLGGTLLSWIAHQRGLSYEVMDVGALDSASSVSSGIINPLTGPKFVKSWMVDELIDSAVPTYRELGDYLGMDILHRVPLQRHIKNIQLENIWHTRRLDTAYQRYTLDEGMPAKLRSLFPEAHLFGEIDAYRVEVKNMIEGWREYIKTRGSLVEEEFSESLIKIERSHVLYRDRSFRHIILAMGHKGVHSSLFASDDYRPVKGEVLIVHIPDLHLEDMIKCKKFLIPLGGDQYWVGSNYQHGYADIVPDEREAAPLYEFLDGLDIPYEIVKHQTGIRPSTKYRRPLVGTHGEYQHMHLFNGLGTKGASLAPYFAHRLMHYIVTDEGRMTIDAARRL